MTASDDIANGMPSSNPPINDLSELLFRQVPPEWVQEGIPSSQAFLPMNKDAGMLPIARGAKATAAGAYHHQTVLLDLLSEGTWGITVDETDIAPSQARLSTLSFGDAPAELSNHLVVYGQPLRNDPAHGFIDFRTFPLEARELISKVLLARAAARGRIYPAERETSFT